MAIALANPRVHWHYGRLSLETFGNGGQIMIDQFIAAGEQKWNPYEWSGRFCCPTVMRGRALNIAVPGWRDFTTLCWIEYGGDEYNYMLRIFSMPCVVNWALAIPRKPLIIMSPKANLRHPGAYSQVEEFTSGGFREVIRWSLCRCRQSE